MAEALLAPSAAAFGWLLTYLLHSSALIGAVWLATRFVDLHPATRDFLWKMALVGGVGTATAGLLTSPAVRSIQVVEGEDVRIGVSRTTSSVGVARDATWAEVDGQTRMRIRARIVEPSPECRALLRSGMPGSAAWPERLTDACDAPSGFAWFQGALALWLLGGGFGLGVLAFRHRALRDVTGSLAEASPHARALLRGLLPGTATESVVLRASDVIDAPCVLPGGIIALPRRCERDLTDAELRAVLAHELAHVTRRDVLWSTVLRGVAAAFWFQPLNRLALEKLAEAAEFTCDDWALARTEHPIELARSISRVAEWMAPVRRRPLAVSMAGSGETGLSSRVRRILLTTRPRSERVWLRPIAAALLLTPLYWLPAVPAPITLAASIVIEEGDVELSASPLRPVERATAIYVTGEGAGTAIERHVFVARLHR